MLNKQFSTLSLISNPPPRCLWISPAPAASWGAHRGHSHLGRWDKALLCEKNQPADVKCPLSPESCTFSTPEHVSTPGAGGVPSGLLKNAVSLSKWIFLSGSITASFPRVPIMCCVCLKQPVPSSISLSSLDVLLSGQLSRDSLLSS